MDHLKTEPVSRPPLSLRQRTEIGLLDLGTTAEAWMAIAVARFCVHFCFRLVARWALTVRPAGSPSPHPHLETRVARSILRASSLLPGTSLCLPQAMAAKWMLERRGYPATIHLGVGMERGARFHAHAWLDAGGAIITGADSILTVTPIPR